MNRKQIVIKNGIIGLVSQITVQFVQFITRVFLLKYMGVEIIGINSTLMSVLQMLALTELGFQTAVVYYLYEPLKKNDVIRINQILEILKRVYTLIGFFFLILSFMLIPFFKYLLKGIEVTGIVLLYFILMSLDNTCTYWVSYKRALIYADQKEYVSKCVDGIFNIFFCIFKIVLIVFTKNYIGVLLLQIVQTVGSNIVIHKYCKQKYKYVKKCKFEIDLFKIIYKDVKNIFSGKLAGFVYGATDNLVISSFVGTIYVGFLSNYKIFVSILKQMVKALFNAMPSIIGNLLIEESDEKRKESVFRIYSYIRYILASCIVIPWIVLADELVTLFWGAQYIMADNIVVLLAIDLYIDIVYSVCCEYINASGKFQEDRRIAVVGAVINVVASMVFVHFMGIEGVLFGTAISQVFFWIGRSGVVYFKIFRGKNEEYVGYIRMNLVWILVLCLSVILIKHVKEILVINNILLYIIVITILCELVNVLFHAVFLHFTREQKTLLQWIRKF